VASGVNLMLWLYKQLGGRRCFIALLIFISANWWLYSEYIKENSFVTLMSWVMGLYVGGNVVQKIFEGKRHDKE
jgi:uncharacterized membrane protein